MTGSALAKNRKKFTFYCFFENKVPFYPIILVNTKTTISLGGQCLALDVYLATSLKQLSPRGQCLALDVYLATSLIYSSINMGS